MITAANIDALRARQVQAQLLSASHLEQAEGFKVRIHDQETPSARVNMRCNYEAELRRATVYRREADDIAAQIRAVYEPVAVQPVKLSAAECADVDEQLEFNLGLLACTRSTLGETA